MNKRIFVFLTFALVFTIIGTPFARASTPVAASSGGAVWTLTPPNPDYVKYLADLAAKKKVSPIMPPRVDLRSLAAARQLSPVPPPPDPVLNSLPSAYDLRTVGRVSPARVTECGSCWTSASIGALESYLLPFEKWDFSEDHMQLKRGWDYPACGAGANADTAIDYLATWRGPVKESDFSYPSHTHRTPPVQKHLQNAFHLPDRQHPLDNDWIKLAVMFYGGIYSNASQSFGADLDKHTYYNPVHTGNHAVVIVGWDDNFDRNKFYFNDPNAAEDLRVPRGNGAFIAKNNEGPDWMENGFYYISYYDKAVGQELTVFTAEPTTNYNRMYQYDPLGMTDSLSVADAVAGMRNDAANVFTAEADDYLTAVGFYNLVENNFSPVDYRIRVFLDPPEGTPVPRDTMPAATMKTTLVFPGYYTVKLPNKVPLTKGKKFSVVVSGIGTDDGWGAPVAVEGPAYGYSTAKANPGESYVSADGGTWQDVTTVEVYNYQTQTYEPLTNTNVCIKAYTTPKWSITLRSAHPATRKLAWTIGNENSTAAWIKPVAQLYRKTREGFSRLGGEVTSDYYLDRRGARHRIFGGWLRVGPGETLTVFAETRNLPRAEQITYGYHFIDPSSRLIRVSEIWKYFYPDTPLHLVSTDPMNNQQVYNQLNVITVVFDKNIKTGPGLHNISLQSIGQPIEIKTTYNSVGGNQLLIVPNGPIMAPLSGEPDGTLWQVRIPADAVTDLSGNPMEQDYTWTFTMRRGTY